jgi:hypothetical protein
MALTELSALIKEIGAIDHTTHDVIYDKVIHPTSGVMTIAFSVQPKNARNSTKIELR